MIRRKGFNVVRKRTMFTAKLEEVFRRHNCDLQSLSCKNLKPQRPLILLAGDLLTGKSTLGINLSEKWNGQFYSVGGLFREVAAERNMAAHELSKALLMDPSAQGIDVELDFRTCKLIAEHEMPRNKAMAIIEGRQPAYMGAYMAEKHHRTNLFRIYLKCSARERALRFLKRNKCSELVVDRADAEWPWPERDGTEEGNDAQSWVARVARAGEGIEEKSGVGETYEELAKSFEADQQRDDFDHQRYLNLYGIDYRNHGVYDAIVDTSNANAEDNLRKTLKALQEINFPLQ